MVDTAGQDPFAGLGRVVEQPEDDPFAALGREASPNTGAGAALQDVLSQTADPREQELLTAVFEAQTSGDQQATRRALARLAGFRNAQDVEPGASFERLGSTFETALRNIAGFGIPGLSDSAAATGTQLGSLARSVFSDEEPIDFRTALEFQRGRREGMNRLNPISAGGGQAAGILSGAAVSPVQGAGRALASAGGRAQGPVRGLIQRLGRALQTRRGQPISNTARTAADAGVVAGGAALADTGDPEQAGEAARTGATIGALMPPAFRAGQAAIRRAVPQEFSGTVIPALARRIGRDPGELMRDFQRFRQEFGRNPRLVELLDPQEARDIGGAVNIGLGSGAPGRLQQNLDEVTATRNVEVPEAIQRGRLNVSAPRVRVRRDRAMTDFMNNRTPRQVRGRGSDQPFGDQRVRISTDDAQAVFSPEVLEEMPVEARRLVSRSLDLEARGRTAGSLTLRELDDLRQALNARGLVDTSRAMRAIAESEFPEYGAALRGFARRSQAAEGVEQGRRVVDTENAQQFVESISDAPAPQRAGARVGARGRLAERAAQTPSDAFRVAEDLAENRGVGRTAGAAMGAEQAARLQEVGRLASRAQRSSALATPRVRTANQQDQEVADAAIAAAFAASGRATGAFQAGLVEQLVRPLRGDVGRARALSKALTNPETTERTINRLQQLGMTRERILQAIQTAARAAGISAGVEAEPEPENL